MSNIGKKEIKIPENVTVDKIMGTVLKIIGPLGKKNIKLFPNELTVNIAKNRIKIEPKSISKKSKSLWGLLRSLIANGIKGVHTGFSVILELKGMGYNAVIEDKKLILNLGYSHKIVYNIPMNIEIRVQTPTIIVIEGTDKNIVTQTAADIRHFRQPDAYKGKGVTFFGEVLNLKEGKKNN